MKSMKEIKRPDYPLPGFLDSRVLLATRLGI